MFELAVFNNKPKLSPPTNARISRKSKKHFRYILVCYQQPLKHIYFKMNKISFIEGIFAVSF